MALLQITEPGQDLQNQESLEFIIGIDLGTTNSLVGIIRDSKVEILADEFGNNIIPSTVSYNEDGEVIGVGVNDGLQISSIKRLMGKSFSDLESKNFPFKIIDEKGLRIVIGSRKIRPEEVAAEILKYLKNIAEKNLNIQIKKAVITVPAYFDEAAKNATKLAANLANLEVIRLVNEPTAAALAYGLENSSEGLYCVYDLGGGTFDVSILKMQKGVFRVLGVSGDNQLGGDDFDELIINKLPNLDKVKAKKIKEELSIANVDSSALMTKKDFEDLILKKIDKTISLTKNLLEDLDLEALQVKGVILVGGSTRIPLVRKKLAEIFGEVKILTNLDPDRVVAIGAAWQAYNLSGKGNNLLLDVIPLSLGIVMMGDIVDKVIMRNSSIPTSVSKEFTTYADNQTGMKLHIVQGERELAADCRSLAEFEIKNIPPMKAGLARVVITFKVDVDGLLTVIAEEKTTKSKQEIIVKTTYGLDEEEVKKMLIDSLKNSKIDIEKRLLAKVIIDAKKDIAILKQDLNEFGNLINKNDIENINQNIGDLEKLIEDKFDRKAIEKVLENLEKSAENLVLAKVNMALNAKITGRKISEI